MAHKIFLNLSAQQAEMVYRHGFKPAVSLLVGESVGGLWQVCNCGFGRELMAPFRVCFVEDLPFHLARRENRGAMPGKEIVFTTSEKAVELPLECPCELQSWLLKSAPAEPMLTEPVPARSEFSLALESFVRRNQ